jgi:hypothetical protein
VSMIQIQLLADKKAARHFHAREQSRQRNVLFVEVPFAPDHSEEYGVHSKVILGPTFRSASRIGPEKSFLGTYPVQEGK